MANLKKSLRTIDKLISSVAHVAILSHGVKTYHKIKSRALRGRKGKEQPMKKTTIIALVALIAAAAGALATVYCYLRRREAELEDYEDMLFDEDELCECDCELDECGDDCCCEKADPAVQDGE